MTTPPLHAQNLEQPAFIDKPRILLIDDDRVVEEMIRFSFRHQYNVETIDSCVDLAYRLESFHPHLIILDIGLPWINGLDLCRDLRQSARYRKVPVLFLSAMNTLEDISAGMNAGGDAYMTKPFRLTLLKNQVAALLGPHPIATQSPAPSPK